MKINTRVLKNNWKKNMSNENYFFYPNGTLIEVIA